MSPEERKKQATQVLILLVLLGVMVAMVVFVLLPSMQPKKKRGAGSAGSKPAAAEQRDARAAGGKAKTTATDTPKVPTAKKGGVELAEGVENVSGVPTGLNPNLFQVFDLPVSRNPFVQQEEWYKDKLAEAVPGYPQLRDSNYFDSMEPYLPDLTSLFGNKDWAQVDVKRAQKNTFSISGSNKDGTIDTSITLQEATPTSRSLTWTPDSGIPLAALSDPGYVASLNLPDGGQLGGGNLAGGLSAPDNRDLFGGADSAAIPNLDDFLAEGGGSAEQLGPNAAVLGQGDQLTCRGVNLTAAEASALIDFNGMPFLVRQGDVLPTHYEVLEVKGDGVMIKELRDGSTQWLPLTLLLETAAAGTGKAK